MDTTFFYHPVFLEHDNGPHPESPARLRVILSHLQEVFGERLRVTEPGTAAIEDLTGVHDRAYLESVARLCRNGGGDLDADTPVSLRSFEAALLGAGAMQGCADALMLGKTRSAFALVRPPGHHARPAAGMGFCVINNIAVAAEHLKRRHNVKRILIADFDVHHGNGTQEIFYRDASVFFLSIHRILFYPGTGGAIERGEGPGLGKTLNLPIMFGTPPHAFVDAFASGLRRASEAHDPEILLVSAGFDAYAHDPVGGLGLMPEHYRSIADSIRETAERFCNGKILTTLEGGYSLSGLPLCLEAYVRGLEGMASRE
ncbi:MAG: histone deacetylase [Planctomycetota bacterium]